MSQGHAYHGGIRHARSRSVESEVGSRGADDVTVLNPDDVAVLKAYVSVT